MDVIAISGSPSLNSRSLALMRLALARLDGTVREDRTILVRDLPAQALVHADFGNAAIAAAVARVERAEVLVISTPIYKAAYSGLLKAFLDLLPQDALRGKLVLPLATGGSLAHFLSLDYALKPVLAALGARDILDGVFATDDQMRVGSCGGFIPDAQLVARIDRALQPLAERYPLAREALFEPALRIGRTRAA